MLAELGTKKKSIFRRLFQWFRGDEAVFYLAFLSCLSLGACAALYLSHTPENINVNLRPKANTFQTTQKTTYINYSPAKSVERAEKKTWYCDAGSCVGGNGTTYHCGATLCDLKITECGCTCIEVSGAPYPKSYCGKVNPFEGKETEKDSYARWIFHPFEAATSK